jgi:hypothetical protein
MPKVATGLKNQSERVLGMQEVRSVTWERPEVAFKSYPNGVKNHSNAPIESEYARNRYDRFLEYLEQMITVVPLNVSTFREEVQSLRNRSPEAFNDLIEWIFNDDDISLLPREIGRLSASEVDFRANRIKSCQRCNRLFYDISRNGRTTVCHLTPAVKWDKSKNAYKAYFSKDGSLKSVCQLDNENAAARRSYNRKESGVECESYALTWNQLDSYFKKGGLLFPPVASTESEKRFLYQVERAIGYSADPQDIVCDEERPTHSFYMKPKPVRKLVTKDWGGETFYRVDIGNGQTDGKAMFENKILPIKKELPRPRKQT